MKKEPEMPGRTSKFIRGSLKKINHTNTCRKGAGRQGMTRPAITASDWLSFSDSCTMWQGMLNVLELLDWLAAACDLIPFDKDPGT